MVGALVARGSRSTVYAYGDGAVIKLPLPSTPPSWVRFEAAYAGAARAAGAPVPALLGLEHFDGRPASVWERANGASLWQRIIDVPAAAKAAGRLLADVQLSLFDLSPPVQLPNGRDRLASKVRAAAKAEPGVRSALDLLRGSAAPRLCHGDLHPSNIVLTPDGPVVVDWFDAVVGDPVADVARTTLVLRGRAPSHLPGAHPDQLAAVAAAYLERIATQLDLAELDRWQAVGAVARLSEGVDRLALRALWDAYAATTDRSAS